MSLKADLLAYFDSQPAVTLAEGKSRQETYANLPDELYEMAEAMSSEGSKSSLLERLENLIVVTREAMKLVEGSSTTDAFAKRFAMPLACVGALHEWDGDSRGKGAPEPEAMTFAEARPDAMLAKVAGEIRLAEEVDYGRAMDLALERDPLLALRYETDGNTRRLSKGAKVEPPRGMHLCETRPDVEIAERAQAIAKAEGTSYAEAERRLLAENPKLKSRYHDYTMGESALDELAYRVTTIRSASGGRVTQKKAVDAALAEDAVLREAVMAYFEPNPYKSSN
jgi:hypothetical protein